MHVVLPESGGDERPTPNVTVDTGVSGDTELVGNNYQAHIDDLNARMIDAAANLEFEEAARIRDEIRRLEAVELGLGKPGVSKLAAAQAGLDKSRMPQKKMQQQSWEGGCPLTLILMLGLYGILKFGGIT